MNIVEDLKWRELIYATTDPEILNVLQNVGVKWTASGSLWRGRSLEHVSNAVPRRMIVEYRTRLIDHLVNYLVKAKNIVDNV